MLNSYVYMYCGVAAHGDFCKKTDSGDGSGCLETKSQRMIPLTFFRVPDLLFPWRDKNPYIR